MSGDRITEALRVTKPEKDARRIEIQCLEVPGTDIEDYKVCLTPKTKRDEPGKIHKGMSGWVEPIERVFAGKHGKRDLMKYLEEVI